jgi:hypothetical protein
LDEQTIVRVVDLDSDEAVWLRDANVILVARHLTQEQQAQAITQLSAKWWHPFPRVYA